MVIGTLFQSVTVDGLFSKSLPKDIRGTLNGVYSFFGFVGLLFFTKFGGKMFDTVGPRSPFFLVAWLDLAFALLIITLALCGKFKKVEAMITSNGN